MVSFTSLALLSLAAVGSLAAPSVEKRTGLWHHKSQCMNHADAERVANNYGQLIAAYSDELANAALAKDFTDFSEGVNTLINTCPQGAAAQPLPLLSATFKNRKAFEIGQGQQPAINFKILDLEYNCESVTIRWETTNTAPIPTPRPVVGIIVLKVRQAPAGHSEPWIVHTVYSEFDSGAWLQNLEQAGICSIAQAGSPSIILPSGSAPAPTATNSASIAPASAVVSVPASSYVAASSYAAASSAAPAPSSYAASSGAAPSSYAAAPSSYAASSAAPVSYAASSAAQSSWAPSATASAYTA